MYGTGHLYEDLLKPLNTKYYFESMQIMQTTGQWISTGEYFCGNAPPPIFAVTWFINLGSILSNW